MFISKLTLQRIVSFCVGQIYFFPWKKYILSCLLNNADIFYSLGYYFSTWNKYKLYALYASIHIQIHIMLFILNNCLERAKVSCGRECYLFLVLNDFGMGQMF